jgi:hypothetical protein
MSKSSTRLWQSRDDGTRLGTATGFVLSVLLAFQGCDPGYWFGVRANLKEPLLPECIETTLRKLPEIDRVTISKSQVPDASLPQTSSVKHSPDQYVFEAGDQRGTITQFQKEGRTSLLAGVNGMGPSQETMETMQVFNARIAKHVAEACHARFLDAPPFLCTPDRIRCREALHSQTAK